MTISKYQEQVIHLLLSCKLFFVTQLTVSLAAHCEDLKNHLATYEWSQMEILIA